MNDSAPALAFGPVPSRRLGRGSVAAAGVMTDPGKECYDTATRRGKLQKGDDVKETTDPAGSADGLVQSYALEMCAPACVPGSASWSARACLDVDISEVLPYLNAALEGADYDHAAKTLIWKDKGRSFAFRAHEIRAAPAEDREEGRRLIEEAVACINDIWSRREGIAPRQARRIVPDLMTTYRLLPRTNCGACGFSTCMAFAAAVRERRAQPGDCPVLEEPGYAENRARLAEAVAGRD
jgi:ArsR family metal-binding transcriptional regulator